MFKSVDGKLFDSEQECNDHEQKFAKDTLASLEEMRQVCIHLDGCTRCPFYASLGCNIQRVVGQNGFPSMWNLKAWNIKED